MKRDGRDEIIAYLFIHYVGLAYFQQPIRAMQFNGAELQKQSCFKSKAASKAASKQLFFKAASKSCAAPRSAARRMLRLNVQRSVCVNTLTCRCSGAQHIAAQRSSSPAVSRSNMHLQRSAAYV